jgi:tetratricopeptide (TPR) repeat protein
MIRSRLIAAAAAVLLTAAPAAGQRVADVPSRPALPAAADTNDARVYYNHALDRLGARSPRDAADAFYWAHQLDPSWSAPLYGRYAALLLTHPRRLKLYWEGNRGTVRSPEVMAIDSLYFRALTLDPFLYRRFEKDLIRQYLTTVVEDINRRSASPAEVDHWVTLYLRHDAGPYLRGVVAYGEGRLVEALRLWDESLRQARRKAFIRTERGRLFGQVGNDAAALAEFRHALEEMRGREARNLVYLYESKALLEHSVATVHERMGDAASAREAYGRALQEDLSFFPAHVRLAHMALVAGDTASALGSMALAVEMPAVDAHTRSLYANLLLETGAFAEAAEQLARAIGDSPHYAYPYFVLASVHERRGEHAQAVTRLGEYLARAPRNAPERPVAQRRMEALGSQIRAAAPAGEGGQ